MLAKANVNKFDFLVELVDVALVLTSSFLLKTFLVFFVKESCCKLLLNTSPLPLWEIHSVLAKLKMEPIVKEIMEKRKN